MLFCFFCNLVGLLEFTRVRITPIEKKASKFILSVLMSMILFLGWLLCCSPNFQFVFMGRIRKMERAENIRKFSSCLHMFPACEHTHTVAGLQEVLLPVVYLAFLGSSLFF